MKIHCFSVVVLASVLMMAGSAAAQTTNYAYDFTGYNVDPADMETVFGPKVAEVDAGGVGYSFGAGLDAFRNLNLISQVFRIQQDVVIGNGSLGQIVAPAGGYVFAYTLDYTGTSNGVPESPVDDLKLLHLMERPGIFPGGAISNPGDFAALTEIVGAAYNTFNLPGRNLPNVVPPGPTPPFELYPAGVDGVENNYADFAGFGPFMSSEIDFEWPGAGTRVNPGTTAMALLFTTPDVQIWQIGVGTGDSGEGAEVFGGGEGLDGIPALIPVVPEPASGLVLLLGGGLFLLKRRPGAGR